MKRSTTLGFVLVLLAAALAFLPGSALAMAPTTETEQFHRYIPNYVDCGTFQVIGDFDISRTDVTFYDQNGTPVRQVFHIHITGTLTNSVTGASLPAYRNGIVVVDLLTGTLTADGQVIRVNAPGEGSILLDTGRFIRDANGNLVFEAGPHPIQLYVDGDTSGIQELCAALS